MENQKTAQIHQTVAPILKTTTLTRQLFIWTVFLGLTLASTFCNGQMKTNLTKDTLKKQKIITSGQPKVIKNHFIDQYPQTYWFVQCGLQDKSGNLWFGTNADGVYCYDGKSFTNYTRKDGLCHNDVLCILEDKTGNIWFGTRGGLCRYKPTTDKSQRKSFTNIPISANGEGYTNNFVWSIMQDRTGKIWCGTNEGVYFYDPVIDLKDDALVFKFFLNNDSIINKNNLKLKVVQKIVEDKKGNLWFASGDFEGEGICCYNGKSIVNFKPDNVKSFRSILESKNGDLLFLSQHKGVYRYDGKTFTNITEKTELKNETITAALEDKKGNLWLGTDSNNNNLEKEGNGGTWCFDGNTFKLSTTKDGLSHNSVFCIIQDREGNIWFGTRNTGLCRYDGKIFTDFTE